MNILIVGTGYVGTTTGLVFAEWGHQVTGLDTDVGKINALHQGKLHFYEPGLKELLLQNLDHGRIQFTQDAEQAITDNDLIFICVGTPANADGSANLTYVRQVAQTIGRHMNRYKIVVNKSTVPIGSAEKIEQWIAETQKCNALFDVISNPEFLREGSALEDALHPDRVVIGSNSDKATTIIQKLYQSAHAPIIVTTPKAAEMIKYASNSFLAMKISYVNEMARLCDHLRVNIDDVAEGMGLDSRIGNQFLKAGIGYGGSCFPKDIKALLNTADQYGSSLSILKQVIQVNHTQPLYFLNKVKNRLGSLAGRKIALWGVAFKPYTDDTRESPALALLHEFIRLNATVLVHDPIVQLQDIDGIEQSTERIQQCPLLLDTTQTADAIVICTDWPEYQAVDWQQVYRNMNTPIVFDGRNMLEASPLRTIGFEYAGVGYG